jgi:hypothetical protein
MDVREIIRADLNDGTRCGVASASCPHRLAAATDQLSRIPQDQQGDGRHERPDGINPLTAEPREKYEELRRARGRRARATG